MLRRDFLSPCSLITGHSASQTLQFRFDPSAHFVVQNRDGSGSRSVVRPYVAKFSPHDPLLVATGGEDGVLSVIRANTDRIDSAMGATNTIFDLAFLRGTSNLICAGSGDEQVHFFDIGQFKTVSAHARHLGSVVCVQDTQRGIISGGRDGSVCLWDHRLKDAVFFVQLKNQAPVSAVSAPSDDVFIVSDSHGKIGAWDFRGQKQMLDLPMPKTETRSSVAHMCLSPDGRYLGSIITNNTLLIHRTGGDWGYRARHWSGIGARYVRCCFSPDSRYIITGSTGGELCVFGVGKKCPPWTFQGHTNTATCVEWCENSFDHVVSCSDDRIVQLWTTEYDAVDDAEEVDDNDIEEVVVHDTRHVSAPVVPRILTLHHFWK